MLATGSLAPDFELESHDGTSLRLASLVERGPVLLYFLKKGCETSDMALPLIEQLWVEHREHASPEGSSLSVLGIAQEDRPAAAEIHRERSLSMTLLADATLAVSRLYELDITPTLLLLRGTERLRVDSERVARDEGFRITDVVEGFSREGYSQVADEIAARIGTLPADLFAGRRLPEMRPG